MKKFIYWLENLYDGLNPYVQTLIAAIVGSVLGSLIVGILLLTVLKGLLQ